ncbi:MAG: hypothetical protein GY861_28070 [bacterium]|nr:hypothetical protein [bacterium]
MPKPKTTEIVFRSVSGKKIVHYRRPYGSKAAKKMMDEVDSLPKDTPYFYRHV